MEGYKVIFHYSNKNISEMFKAYLQHEFVERREIAVQHANPHFEEWNEEYNDIYPADAEDITYKNFICEKMKESVKVANEANIGANIVKLDINVEHECNYFGICEMFNTTIDLFLRKDK